MRKLRIGVIGCGAIGRQHAQRLIEKVPEAEVTGVCDYIADAARAFCAQYHVPFFATAEELIASPTIDAVLVTSSDPTHAGFVLEVLRQSKYVFCEKPLAQTAAECENIIKAECRCGKRLVQVGFMRRYDRGYAEIKRILVSGALGAPLMIHAAHRNMSQAPGFATDYAVTRIAIHELDISRWLLDDEYESAQVLDVRQSSATQGAWLNPQIMQLRTRSGQRIDIEVQTDGAYAYDIQCQVVAEHGTVSLPDPAAIVRRADAQCSFPILTDWSQRFIEAYDIEFGAWVRAVLDGQLTGPSSWDGYAACVAADALIQSRTSGKPERIVMMDKPSIY